MTQNEKEYRDYLKKFDRLAGQIMPQIVADTLNTVGRAAHDDSLRNIRSRFVIRNQYTERSVRFYHAKANRGWRQINAVSGSVSDYMDEQDQGGRRRPKQGSKAPVATLAARGGSAGRVVRKQYRAGQLSDRQFVGKPRGGNRPPGVYERIRNNKRLRMIRNLKNAFVPIEARHWHTDAMEKRGDRRHIEDEFRARAEAELKKISK